VGSVSAVVVRSPTGSERRTAPTEDEVCQPDPAGGIVECEYGWRPALLDEIRRSTRPGLWRFAPLLALPDDVPPHPMPVGNTPLLPAPALAARFHLGQLWVKDESRSPTLSSKDRATAMVLAYAAHRGIGTVTCASSGNAAASLAVLAAAVGIRAVVFVPEEVAEAKLALMLVAGAVVFRVRGGYGAAYALSRTAALEFGWYERNTGVNPLTVEAKKTIAFEIWDDLGGRCPDVVVVSAGDGVTAAALDQGFRDLVACGGASRVPRLIGVQSRGCAPLVEAFHGDGSVKEVEPQTVADGIAVGSPVMGAAAVAAARSSGGTFVAVVDDDLVPMASAVASTTGLLPEPAAAAAFCGLTEARRTGDVGRDEEVVVVLTGSLLKTPFVGRAAAAPDRAGRVHLVDARLDAVAEAMAEAR
jgi:threonine synthase